VTQQYEERIEKMAATQRFRRRAAATLLALCLLLVPALDVAAAGIYTSGDTGYDISWPQCDAAYPHIPAYSLAVVGVTSGHAFRNNPCFASQYAWATARNLAPESVYLNLNEDIGTTAGYGETGPYGNCAPETACHALNYGYNAASRPTPTSRRSHRTLSHKCGGWTSKRRTHGQRTTWGAIKK